ncbi:MAG: glucosaminidase domain-containing protein [Polyangiaceae bacterium]
MRIEYSGSTVSAAHSDRSVSKAEFRVQVKHLPEAQTRPEQVHAQLGCAWSAVVGTPAPPQALAILTAHWALETDAGRAMPGHNFAGIKAAPSARGALLTTVEGYGSTRREVSARFRVYDSAEAGARDYVHLLATRFPAALAAARAGSAAGFARALAQGSYFTADPVAYAAGLERRLHSLDPGAPLAATSAPGALAQIALAGVLGALRDRSDDP